MTAPGIPSHSAQRLCASVSLWERILAVSGHEVHEEVFEGRFTRVVGALVGTVLTPVRGVAVGADVRQDRPVRKLEGDRPAFGGEHRFKGRAPDQFKGFERGPAVGFEAREERLDVGEAPEREKQRAARPRRRLKFENRLRDDAERAFGTDEEVPKVVARIVFSEGPHEVENPPVGKHDLKPENERPGRAVAKDVHAPGVCRENAADAGTPFGGKRQRKDPPRFARRPLQVGEHHARFDDGRVVDGVDVENSIHALRLQEDRARGVKIGEVRVGRRAFDV